MKGTQMPPVHAANLVANSGNTAYRVWEKFWSLGAEGRPLVFNTVLASIHLAVSMARRIVRPREVSKPQDSSVKYRHHLRPQMDDIVGKTYQT